MCSNYYIGVPDIVKRRMADIAKLTSLSVSDPKAAVIYYYFKAKTVCTGEAVKNYLLASAVLSSLDSENSELYAESDKLITSTNTQLIKNQPAYEALPDALKGKLSALEVLNKPFNLLKSVEALGLE
jgi:hypothetical protein